jgi:hypothetical protein
MMKVAVNSNMSIAIRLIPVSRITILPVPVSQKSTGAANARGDS